MIEVYSHPVVKNVMLLHTELLSTYPEEMTVMEVLDRQAKTLFCHFKDSDQDVGIQLSNWLPECAGLSFEAILKQDFTLHHMRLAVAKEHGYESWAVAEYDGQQLLNAGFENAVDAVLNGNLKKLKELITEQPALVHTRSQYGHRATLLIYLAANGVETWRQVVPANAPAVMKLLLDSGADPHTRIHVYGGLHSFLELLLSSAHPRTAGVVDEMVELLGCYD